MEIQRESIFVSALRSFCRMFFAVVGIMLAFILVSYLYSSLSGTATTIDDRTKIKYLPDANNKRELVASTAPVILQLNIHGVIGEPKVLDTDIVQDILVESRTGTLKNDRVKGILLHMNTPGGTVIDSDNIYQMLMKYKEQYKVPVFAYVDGLSASGGMYIMCAADQVYAGPAAVIGSVGIIMGPFFNFFEGLENIGIKSRTLTKGLDKDMMSPFRPWKEGEDASLKALADFFYDRFVNLVATSRPRIDREKLVSVYGAQVYDPVAAQNFGYIDVANSSRNETLLALMKEANVDPTKPYQVVTLEEKSEWLSTLFNQTSPIVTGKIEHSLDTGSPKIRDQFAYLYQPMEN